LRIGRPMRRREVVAAMTRLELGDTCRHDTH
jgi:hypothetical protein